MLLLVVSLHHLRQKTIRQKTIMKVLAVAAVLNYDIKFDLPGQSTRIAWWWTVVFSLRSWKGSLPIVKSFLIAMLDFVENINFMIKLKIRQQFTVGKMNIISYTFKLRLNDMEICTFLSNAAAMIVRSKQKSRHYEPHNPSVRSDEGLTSKRQLNTISPRRQIYHINLCWSNPYSSLLAHAKNSFFSKLVFQWLWAMVQFRIRTSRCIQWLRTRSYNVSLDLMLNVLIYYCRHELSDNLLYCWRFELLILLVGIYVYSTGSRGYHCNRIGFCVDTKWKQQQLFAVQKLFRYETYHFRKRYVSSWKRVHEKCAIKIVLGRPIHYCN